MANNSNPEEGFTETTLKVGVTCALTGPFADLERQPCQAIQAYFRFLNANGGVHGRKFQVILADDEFTNAGKGAAAVRRFVEQDKVFLLDLTISPFTCSIIGEYVNQKKVPTYCTGIFTSEFGQPYIFVNMPPAIITTNHIAGQWIPANMGKRVGLVTHSAPEWVKGGAEFRHALEDNGGQLVSEQRTALDETDYTAAVVNTRAANPDVVFLNLMPDGVLKWYLAAQRVNYDPPILNPITGEAALVPDGVGEFVLPYRCVTLLRPPERGTPAGDRFFTIMTGYYPNTDWRSIDVPTRQSYAASQIMEQGLELVGPRLSRASFMDILNSGREFTTGGLSPGVRWEPTHTKPAYTQGLITEFDPKSHGWKPVTGTIQDQYTNRY
ncbi:MAG: ABC transporter substrate-binding protein [Actinomycetota bacterium]